MDSESKKLLEDTFKLAQDNNHMLRKVRSVQKYTIFWSLFKIFVVIGIAFGSFFFLEPFVNKFITIWNNVSGSQQQKLDSNPVQDFFKRF